jgi:hypothetical protein
VDGVMKNPRGVEKNIRKRSVSVNFKDKEKDSNQVLF